MTRPLAIALTVIGAGLLDIPAGFGPVAAGLWDIACMQRLLVGALEAATETELIWDKAKERLERWEAAAPEADVYFEDGLGANMDYLISTVRLS